MSTSFRGDIEGLRGIAILVVVLFHLGVPGFSGGFIGVDVFFVLSGYLISGILAAEIEATGRLDLVRFYARRARRLLPAALLVIVVTIIGAWFVYAPSEQRYLAASAFFAATYVSNLWFGHETLDYFGANPETNPFLHTWSLSVEEQFYLVWPLLMLAASGAWQRRISRRRLVGIMAVAAAVSFVSSLILTATIQPWAFFLSPPRAWEFAVGALAALIPRRSAGPASASRLPLVWLGLLSVFGSTFLLSKQSLFPGWLVVPAVLGTAAALRAGPGLGNPLDTAPLRWLGRISYSLYLWHWPVLVLPVAAFGPQPIPVRLALGGLAVLLAMASLRLVEDPIRHGGWLAARPRISLVGAIGVTALVATASVAWRVHASGAAVTPAQLRFTRAAEDYDALIAAGCALDLLTAAPRPCVFGDTSGTHTLVLMGDSHAGQWFDAVDSIAKGRGWRVVVAVKSECPVPLVEYVHPRLKRRYAECGRWRDQVLARIDSLRPFAVITASSYAYTRIYDVSESAWQSGLEAVLTRLTATGSQVVLLRDTPRPNFHVPTCLARAQWPPFLSRGGACAFDLAEAMYEEVYALEQAAAARVEGVTVVDLTAEICESPLCYPDAGTMVKFRDSNHLTATMVRHLAPALAAQLPFPPQRTAVPGA